MVPASIFAQTQADSKTQRLEESARPPGKVKGLTSSSVLSYDSSGNLINDGSRVITWDVEGKPVKVTTDNLEVLFIYDSNGGRIAKIVKDKSTGNLKLATLYLGGNLEKEINYLPAVSASVATSAKEAASAKEGQQLTANSQPLITTTRYYFANGKRIAQRKTNNIQQTTGNIQQGTTTEELLFIHQDHLSSSTLFTDSQGNQKDSLLTYYPYGEERKGWDLPAVSASVATSAKEAASAKEGQSTANSQQSTPTNHLYTDQIKDPETDLYYYNARYYDPRIGLFISADTAGNSLNRYAYVSNNPLVLVDPKGTDSWYFQQQQFIQMWFASRPANNQQPTTYIGAASPPSPTYIGAMPGSPTSITTPNDVTFQSYFARITNDPLGYLSSWVDATGYILTYSLTNNPLSFFTGGDESLRAANPNYEGVAQGLDVMMPLMAMASMGMVNSAKPPITYGTYNDFYDMSRADQARMRYLAKKLSQELTQMTGDKFTFDTAYRQMMRYADQIIIARETEGGTIVGYLTSSPYKNWVYAMSGYVLPDYRQMDVFTTMLLRTERLARSEGFEGIHMQVVNPILVRILQELGYIITAWHEDTALMQKLLK
ncbi:hypothetical protein FJY90_03760 [Candidatus Gottesmanbacteria bacterium]|nr:hypothetical protein [Candidatus Gottesmanbacteria bacterium]